MPERSEREQLVRPQRRRPLQRPAAVAHEPDEGLVARLGRSRSPEQLVALLGRADRSARSAVLARLQVGGNAATARIVRRASRLARRRRMLDDEPARPEAPPELLRSSFPVAATVRHGVYRPEPFTMIAALTADAMPGHEDHVEPADVEPLGEPERVAPTAEGEGGEETAVQPSAPIRLPDVEIPMLRELGTSDAVTGAVGYKGTVVRGGTPAMPATWFGGTWWGDLKLAGITVTPSTGKFDVKATAEHTIRYEVRSGKGPNNEVDIASDADPDITNENYPDVVKDLTPDMGDLKGRPPRAGFWAEDITIRHEHYHADDAKGRAPASVQVAVAWLGTQTASKLDEVSALVKAVPGRAVTALSTSMAAPAREERSYTDGAPSYTARATAVEKKGKKGEYPKKK